MNLRNLTIVRLISALMLFTAGCNSLENRPPDINLPENTPPEITSPALVEASGDIYFVYRVTFTDPDDSIQTVAYDFQPSWLAADADSIFGTPPDGAADSGFLVVVSDGQAADSAEVTIDMIPAMAVYGDSRTGHTYHQMVVDTMMTVKPAVVFHTGDLVNDGRIASDWVTFNNITATMRAEAEFFPALGNHEQQSQLYFDNFELPGNEQWYSVERNHCHFIILNSCIQTSDTSEQYRWLEADLAGIDDSIRFVAAVFHHPPYSTGQHTEDEEGLRNTWVPLLEQYGVDIIFNGHDHDYERSYCGGRYYIVAGGGGAPLRAQARTHPCSQLFLMSYHFCKVSVVDRRMIVRVYNNLNQLIDQIEIDKTAGLAPE